MSIYDIFPTREALIEELTKSIQTKTNDEGEETFFIENALGDLKAKFDSEVKQSQSYRHRAQEAENKIKEIEREISRLTMTNEELSKLNPEKQREQIMDLTKQIGSLKADKEELEKSIVPLNERIHGYEKKETQRTIESELRNTAVELGIRSEAMRDVLLRSSGLTIGETGLVQTPDGVMLRDYLKSELENSPHWLPPSKGGGSSPGNSAAKLDNEALYEQAKAKGDFATMIGTAKTFEGLTLGKTD